MKLIIITSPETLKAEDSFIPLLLENGLEFLHLRKPLWTKKQLSSFLNEIPQEFHKQIIMHSNHNLTEDFNLGGIHIKEADKTFISSKKNKLHSIAIHNLSEINSIPSAFRYALLSPVFNSISKQNVKAAFNHEELKKILTSRKNDIPVYALGGINIKNMGIAKDIGFDGVAVMGYLWNIFKRYGAEAALKKFKNLNALCQ